MLRHDCAWGCTAVPKRFVSGEADSALKAAQAVTTAAISDGKTDRE